MTSIPASRSAAATTLAPRSCPSRPGFATSTRIGLIETSKLLAATRKRQLGLLLARDEQHLGRSASQGSILECVVRLLNQQACVRAQLRETGRRVESQP